MTASLASNLPSGADNAVSMTFAGRGRDFFGMLVKGSLFQIPTFGFYRFWLITKLRRHLWANTKVGGEAFEYTGTAKELLIGFLIALAILTPLYIAYFVAGIMLEEKAALASLPLILVMYVLMHFGAYRARRYRATRTVFRGVRFWMKGSGWAYAFRAILWDFVTLLTIGLALPWATASLERYRMRHTYFGTVQGDFTGTGWTLFKRGIWVWLLGVIVAWGSVGLAVWFGQAYPEKKESAGLIVMAAYLTLFLGIMPLAMAVFTRWQMDGLRFGDVAVSSNLRVGACYGLIFKLLFSSIGFLLVFAMVIGGGAAVAALFFQEALQSVKQGGLTPASVTLYALFAMAYLVLLLGFGVIYRYFLGRGLWVLIVNSITVTNLHAVDAAAAAGQPSGVLGEGIADALDFNVGV